LFDLTQITNFADDNFVVSWNEQLSVLIENLERDLEVIVKWLKDSFIKVNEGKTEMCLFHCKDQPSTTIKLQGLTIKTKKEMNVLGRVHTMQFLAVVYYFCIYMFY
jgi:hypothetical protein